MKQFTTYGQTAHLVALGFPTPKSVSKLTLDIDMDTIPTFNYSIGELIEMLPENVAKENKIPSTLNISVLNGEWCVQYADFSGTDFEFCNTELIDALYDMAVKLKEEDVL